MDMARPLAPLRMPKALGRAETIPGDLLTDSHLHSRAFKYSVLSVPRPSLTG